jgi:hypothetical protein
VLKRHLEDLEDEINTLSCLPFWVGAREDDLRVNQS